MKKLVVAIIIGTIMFLSVGCNTKLVLKDTSNGNLINKGIIARDGDLLFFSDRINGGIYTLTANNTGFKELLKKPGEYLNINDGIIYFVLGNTINKVREDGLEFKTIYDAKDKIEWMKNRSGWIYYVSCGNFNKIQEDGKGAITLFKEDNISNVNIFGDNVFYTIDDVSQGTFSIISYQLSKNSRTIIKKDSSGKVAGMIFQNNSLYYSLNSKVGEEKSTLNVLETLNKKNEILETSTNIINDINVSKQWIYFVSQDTSGKKTIKRINTITKSKENVDLKETYEVNKGMWQSSNGKGYGDKSFNDFNVLGNWIFFNDDKLKSQLNGIKLR